MNRFRCNSTPSRDPGVFRIASLAQWIAASAYEAGGRGFDTHKRYFFINDL